MVDDVIFVPVMYGCVYIQVEHILNRVNVVRSGGYGTLSTLDIECVFVGEWRAVLHGERGLSELVLQ